MERLEFTGAPGAELAAVLHHPPDGAETVGAALLAHCFTCSKDLFTTTRIADADHLFSNPKHSDELVGAIVAWLSVNRSAS
ncbi:MAG: hypothetical protein OXB92_08040 [Acidimicrobiaceae bacterium]|nr:hypothetical protein [Acidimicrobiia bacterium]MCY4493789.1 hypothetical protein [Acidimicrobiaceae bacterium]